MFEEGQEILDKRYRVIKKLGGGAFGEIYKGTCTLFASIFHILKLGCPFSPLPWRSLCANASIEKRLWAAMEGRCTLLMLSQPASMLETGEHPDTQ